MRSDSSLAVANPLSVRSSQTRLPRRVSPVACEPTTVVSSSCHTYIPIYQAMDGLVGKSPPGSQQLQCHAVQSCAVDGRCGFCPAPVRALPPAVVFSAWSAVGGGSGSWGAGIRGYAERLLSEGRGGRRRHARAAARGGGVDCGGRWQWQQGSLRMEMEMEKRYAGGARHSHVYVRESEGGSGMVEAGSTPTQHPGSTTLPFTPRYQGVCARGVGGGTGSQPVVR